MNAGEINTWAELMNFTMNNPIRGDLDRLIFNSVDIYNSFDRFHFNQHPFFQEHLEFSNKTKLMQDQFTKIFDESILFELAGQNNSDSLGILDEYSFTKFETT